MAMLSYPAYVLSGVRRDNSLDFGFNGKKRNKNENIVSYLLWPHDYICHAEMLKYH